MAFKTHASTEPLNVGNVEHLQEASRILLHRRICDLNGQMSDRIFTNPLHFSNDLIRK